MEREQLIIEALKLNWEHARHIEAQRIRLTTIYIVATLGAGMAALKSEIYWIRCIASILGFVISIFCWAMTHKWNSEFVNQIKSADKCARELKITFEENDKELHEYIGFPQPDPFMPKIINVRRMFHWFYITFIILWLIILILTILKKV